MLRRGWGLVHACVHVHVHVFDLLVCVCVCVCTYGTWNSSHLGLGRIFDFSYGKDSSRNRRALLVSVSHSLFDSMPFDSIEMSLEYLRRFYSLFPPTRYHDSSISKCGVLLIFFPSYMAGFISQI